jgi:hypothetical protein
MTPLHLSPFPSLRIDEIPGKPVTEREDFVDDAVVMALVAGPITQRNAPSSAELALAVDDMDFAGWCLTPAPAIPRDKPPHPLSSPAPSAPQSRPAPPIQNEPGLGDPHRGNHRWWLAGLAGALSTLLFSLLLLSLSARPISEHSDHLIIERLTKPRPSAAIEMTAPRNPTPQLTEAVR